MALIFCCFFLSLKKLSNVYHLCNVIIQVFSIVEHKNESIKFFLGGCSVAPECYYINIRTGTHYFPKGQGHPLGTDNANRFKCGLNRIDEKQAETLLSADYQACYFFFLTYQQNCIMTVNLNNTIEESALS